MLYHVAPGQTAIIISTHRQAFGDFTFVGTCPTNSAMYCRDERPRVSAAGANYLGISRVAPIDADDCQSRLRSDFVGSTLMFSVPNLLHTAMAPHPVIPPLNSGGTRFARA